MKSLIKGLQAHVEGKEGGRGLFFTFAPKGRHSSPENRVFMSTNQNSKIV